ncbi:NADH-quinone oxidoreductase subunit N [Aeromicrobium fastidiosum]|uniref:NADH-quinone oxidoreductase subunit N n=1 Tax=Aeromicrobium fastidiosum TaxID=52699 RepID=A0A641ALP3_9ACTN|nr:NADH-quinone oxidoreductase subunit N [Aeromicrobium fastidiosum]KAA1374804.1 NADH-quinone oxidoreductase subunit N [Aeromicrobium fastidiosum]MBP2390645.1 NADH-quinone oxidoreductase subunit N [Aeromicrobium fastidiosum]
MNIPVDWTVAGPATIVLVGALVALMVDAFYSRRTWLGSGLPASIATVAATAELVRGDASAYPFAFSLVVLIGTLFVVVASNVMNFENAMPPGEYHFLLMSAAAGALLMVSARDLVTLVVALELLSLPSIALVGLRQGDQRAIRSAWTFFLASVVSTAVTLMGVSLLYGVTGTLRYDELADALTVPDVPRSVVSVAVVLTVVGLLFKLGAVPFHLWIPDAYEGGSVMVAGFLSAVSKAAALGALLVLLAVSLPAASDSWQPVVAVVAAVTMTIGNIGALRQDDAIGLLAWSSIAQAGFLLAPAVAVSGPFGLTPAVQYLAVYALANLVAFAALAVLLRLRGSTRLDDLRGLARTDPWMGVPLVFATLTLAGFPPAVIGLVTKYVVIRPVVEDGHVWLGVVMGVNVMLGLAYYLRMIVTLCGRQDGEPYVSPSPPISVRFAKSTVLIGTAALIAVSAWPDLLLSHLP